MGCSKRELTTWGQIATLEYGKALRSYKDNIDTVPVYGTNGQIGFTNHAICDSEGVIIGRKGAYRGIHYSPIPFYVIDTAFYLKPKKAGKFYLKWAYYKLLTLDINSMDSGSAIPSTSRSDFYALSVALPSLLEQKNIIDILSCLDNKIEISNRINKNLEEMAQAIFKHWFVDFEFPDENGNPYKSSGGEMVESELGEIPNGWEVGILKDSVILIDNRGKTPTLSSKNTNFPIIDVKALSGNSRIIDYNNCTKFVEEDTYNNWFRNGHPQQDDILISTVGSLAEMKIFYENKGCIAQNVVGFRSNGLSSLYLYQYLHNIRQDLILYNIGSVQPSIKVTHIIKHKILLPNYNTLKLFESIIDFISNKILLNSKEIQTLTKIRDSLLPKLMSGEIRIPMEEAI